MNLQKTSTKRLRTMIAKRQKSLAHKKAVAARHQPGTSYHTRATLEAAELERQIREYRKEIDSRSG